MQAGKDYIGVGVGALIVDEAGRVFLTQRGPQSKNEHGTWECPGGSVEYGETLEAGLRREMREEFDVEIAVGRRVDLVDHILPQDGQHWVSPTYECRIVSGEPRIMEPEKCSAMGWFRLDDVPDNLSVITRENLEHYRQMLARDAAREGREENPPALWLGGLRLPWKPAVVIILSTLLLMLDWYYDISIVLDLPVETTAERLRNLALYRLLSYLIVPLGVIVFVFREKPAAYGFKLGDWRTGLKWTLIVWAVATPILYVAGRTPAMVSYYARYEQPVGWMLLVTAMDLFGWEFLFRGFILYALYRVAGPSAVILQAVPFAFAHLSKPVVETLSTIFGGTLFGWVAWKADSFLYAFLIHWYIMSFVVVVASLSR